MKKTVSIFFLVILFLTNDVVFTQPQIKINLRAGYNSPLSSFKGKLSEQDTEFENYGMTSGYNYGLDLKYYFGKKRNYGITLSGSYNSFTSGDEYYIRTISGNPNDTGSITRHINFYTAAMGMEYSFTPRSSSSPFAGIEFTANFFNGDEKFTSDITGIEYNSDLKKATRVGISIGGGFDFVFNKTFGGVAGLKYNMANLIGRENETELAVDEFGLNDEEHTVGITSVDKRNINFLQFYAGLSVFINHPKRTVNR